MADRPCQSHQGGSRDGDTDVNIDQGHGEEGSLKLPPNRHDTSCGPQQHWENEEEEDEGSEDTTGDEEEVDPRVQENLEILNQSCAEVNRLENELDEARSQHRYMFQSAYQHMEELGKKIKKNIQRARQYYVLKESAKQAQNEAARAARLYQTANGNYRAAKEMMTLAEQGLDEHGSSNTCGLSSAWQETLNHATARVMESEREKTRTEAEHNRRAAVFGQLETQLHFLERKYKRSIAKARPYFEAKAELELKLQPLRQNVLDLQQTISSRKARYAEALRNLEAVSTEIHESRRLNRESRQNRERLLQMLRREPGVGAETDSLGSSISDLNIERGVFSSSASFDGDEEDTDSDDVEEVFVSDSAERPVPRGMLGNGLSTTAADENQVQTPGAGSTLPATDCHTLGSSTPSGGVNQPACGLQELAQGGVGPGTVPAELQDTQHSSGDLNTDPKDPVPPPEDQRESGDGGSTHEDCLREEEASHSTGLDSPSHASETQPQDQVDQELLAKAIQTNQCTDKTTISPAEAESGQVTKQPLKRTDGSKQKLQGIMLLNPSDLAASSSSASLRF